MSLYHKRVYLRQKNSTINNLINHNNQLLQQHNRQSLNSINKHYQLQSSSSYSRLSSTTKNLLFHNNTTQQQLQLQYNQSTSNSKPTNKTIAKLLTYLNAIANNQIYIIFMSVLTIYTIFAMDIDKGFFNVNASTYFSCVHSLAIGLFIIQIIILSLTKQQYVFKFYFWVDCFSTLTMFLQLIWIQNLMSSASNVTVALSFAKVTKASRLSKIGARSSKIMKLIRLVKLMKLFKKQQQKQQKQQQDRIKQQQQQQQSQQQQNDHEQQQQQQRQQRDNNLKHKTTTRITNKSNNSNFQQQQQHQQQHQQQSQFSSQTNNNKNNNEQNRQLQQQNDSFYNNDDDQYQQGSNDTISDYNNDGQQQGQQQSSSQAQASCQQQQSHRQQQSQFRQQQSSANKNDQHKSQEQSNNVAEMNDRHQHRYTFSFKPLQKHTINNDANSNREEQLSINAEQQYQQQPYSKQQQQQQQQNIQSKFTIPPTPHIIPNNTLNTFGNALSIPQINQPSHLQSHQLISQQDKNNIEDIMKIFFTQNMQHFITKGKSINNNKNNNNNINNNNNHHHALQNKPSIQTNTNKISARKRKLKHHNNKILKKQSKNIKIRNNNSKQKRQFILQQKQQSKQENILSSSKQRKYNKFLSNENNIININKISTNLAINGNNKPVLLSKTQQQQQQHKPQLNTNNIITTQSHNQQHLAINNHAKQRNSRSSSRLSFMKRKQIMELTKYKELREKFNRSYNVNMTLNQIPFANIVQKMEQQLYLPPLNRHKVDPIKQAQIQQKYNQLVQKSKIQNQPKKVLSSQNLKVGEVLKEQIQKNIVIMVMGLIMIIPIITADTWFDSDPSLSLTAHLFIKDIMQIPTIQGRDQLFNSFIQTGLQMNNPLQYFYFPINDTCCQFPRQFPAYINNSLLDYSQLRLSEQMIIVDNNLTIIFSRKQSNQINSYLNLGRSLFITILLIFCSILFMNDIQNHALNPLQKMSSLINKISNNPFQALREINKQKNYSPQSAQSWSSHQLILVNPQSADQQQLQTNILSNVIIKITSLLTIGAGEIGSEIISKNIENVGKQAMNGDLNNDTFNQMKSQKTLGQNLVGVYVYLQLRGFELMCDIFGQQIFRYINKITDIVHLCCIQMGGIPIEYDGKGFLLLFKPNNVLQKIILPQRKSTRHIRSKKSIKLSHHPSHHTKNNSHNNNHNDISQTSSFTSNEQFEQQTEGNILCNLSILAITALDRIILQVNQLQQSRKLYQCILQKYSSNNNNSQNNNNFTNPFQNPDVFSENYEPHLINAAIHVGECIYGSLGSSYKLQCKCIGFDIAYTRHLCHMLAQQSYGVSNILSQDIYTLLSQHQFLIQKLNIRQIDHVNIKQLRHKDYKQNPNIHFMSMNKLQEIKSHKQISTKLYTSDFYGKLEMYNYNESQMINYGHTLSEFRLNKTFMHTDKQLSSHSHLSNQSITNPNHKHSKDSPSNLRSLVSVDDMSQHCLVAYQQRQKWLSFAQHDDPALLMMKLDSQYPQLKQSRLNYQSEFYQGWNEALQSYYNKQLTDSLTEFKYLHTFNQPYYDGPSKVFINRIQNTNIQQINQQQRHYNLSQKNLTNSQKSLNNLRESNYSFGVHNVVWKL